MPIMLQFNEDEIFEDQINYFFKKYKKTLNLQV